METFQIIIFIKIVIVAIANKKEEEEKILFTLEQSNNTLSLMLRIVARIAFDHRRKIDIANLSNREKNILSIVLEFGNKIGVKEKDIGVLLKSFIEISNDQSVYTDISTRKDIEILLECIFRVCMAVSVDEKGNLLEKKKDKLNFLHKNLGIRYNIFDNDNNSSVEDSSKNEYEKYYIILYYIAMLN
jgi:hypothetical protein